MKLIKPQSINNLDMRTNYTYNIDVGRIANDNTGNNENLEKGRLV